MTSGSDSGFPSGFDFAEAFPEDCVVTERQPEQDPSFSEDFAILHAGIAENREEKTKKGIVIQHRAWTLEEALWSDQYRPIKSPTSKYDKGKLPSSSMPSSPPVEHMMDHVPTQENDSSGTSASARKRIRLDEPRSPLKTIDHNVRMRAGFMIESDDEEDEPSLIHKPVKAIETFFPKSPISSPIAQSIPDEHESGHGFSTLELPSEESNALPTLLTMKTFAGRSIYVGERLKKKSISYEQIVASRSVTEEGRAKKAFYGIDMHNLLEEVKLQKTTDQAKREAMDIEPVLVKPVESTNRGRHILWTEKYRAKKFTDLIGDERTHRMVMHWLKSWDPIVFPGLQAAKKGFMKKRPSPDNPVRRPKILLLTGPPGLGKTTLAHVCARQAGYEVHEINASDERSRDVVKGKIRDMVGTENIRGVNQKTENGTVRKAGRPVCVVVDEVDGVVGSSGASEGGFVKALIDLILLDQRNSGTGIKKKNSNSFRLLRPLILICNDVYHPSLRPLRQSSYAEIVHVRKPAIQMVSSRLHGIFQREGILCDADGIRRLCEATWGVSTRKDALAFSGGTSDGDVRSVLVVGEWVASRFKAKSASNTDSRLSKRWIEEHVLSELAYGGGGARSLGRGSSREVVDRVFLENAGFLKSTTDIQVNSRAGVGGSGPIGVSEAGKRRAMNRLTDLVYACGEVDRVVTDCFTTYPSQPIQDDNYLTKPNAAYEWLNFYDRLNTQLTTSQEWEIAPYLPSPVLAFHNLFASSSTTRTFAAQNSRSNKQTEEDEDQPAQAFSTPAAPYTAAELLKANKAAIAAFHSSLSISLSTTYRSRSSIATELLPYVMRMLAPAIKPVVIQTASTDENGTKNIPMASVRKQEEKDKVARAVEAMAATGIRFDRARVETDTNGRGGGWVYRMEPGLEPLVGFDTMNSGGSGETVRYAVRQVLENEWNRKTKKSFGVEHVVGRDAGKKKNGNDDAVKAESRLDVKRDFFGRVIKDDVTSKTQSLNMTTIKVGGNGNDGRVWVSYHEGYSNAVRRPITFEELMRGF